MESFVWETCFVTGLPMVDEQHHYLVDLINQFGDLLMQPQGASPQEIEVLFTELSRYTQYHFQEEEGLMARGGLDARHLAHHVKEHAQFLRDLNHMHADVSANRSEAASALLQFLSSWLAYHILGSDQRMAGAMTAIASGVPADEAYRAFDKERDPATATLLHAMNRLIEQVSDRNRALIELNQSLEARVAERTHELRRMNEQLENLAMTDVLTGLPNRRQAMGILGREWQNALAQGGALSCLMIDADGFKGVNDNYGHDAGDEVLRVLARCMKHAVRNDDVVCRLGGDEFLIICLHTALDGAMKTAEKVRQEVSELRVKAGDGQWVGSVSIGVAQTTPALLMQGTDALLKIADEGVYVAKRNGRNCVASVQDQSV
jgi:hemerythrin